MFVSKMCKARDFKLNHETNPIVLMVIRQAIKDSGITFDLTSHIELWDWLAHNPGKTKLHYFRLMYKGSDFPKAYCFACEFSHKVVEYIREHYGKKVIDYIGSRYRCTDCSVCPFSCDSTESNCLDGIFEEWAEFTEDYYGDEDNEPIILRAREIRDFPIRKDAKIPLK